MPRLSPLPPAAAAPRRGFTLIEMLITVVLFSAVMAALMTVIARQQRYYRGANEIIDVRSQMRQAASLLPTDLRGVSSSGADIQSISDTLIQFNATFGTTVVCSTSGNDTFIAAPIGITRHTLTSWLFVPQTGDSAFVYDEGSRPGSEDDQWLRVKLKTPGTDSTSVTTGCGTFLTNSEAASTSVHRYKFITTASNGLLHSGGASVQVIPGAVVRFARPVRYRFYQSTSDNNWYLGYEEYRNDTWQGTQALAGPYRVYAASGATGMKFTYWTNTGTQITTTDSTARSSIARIDIALRGQGASARNTANGQGGGQFADSLLVRIAVRNRN